MPRRPPGPPCDMVRDCGPAWIAYTAVHKSTHRHIETQHTCRRHKGACIDYMLAIPNARIEVRIAR